LTSLRGGRPLALAYDPDQPRDPGGEGGGQWVDEGSSLESIADVSLPKDDDQYQYFYHAVRYDKDIDSILEQGLKPGTEQGGRGRSSRIYLSKDEIRDRGSGFLIVRVPRGKAKESVDVVEVGLKYRQWDVEKIPSKDVVRAVRMVTDRNGFKIREDELARYALSGKSTTEETQSLPEKYQKWFR
jgi:hypothetical protein